MSVFKKFIVIIIILCSNILFAQVNHLGSPFVKNFSRSEYKAGLQTWAIQQGSNGMMYFGNNDGLLEFDGVFWNTYPLPNNSALRAIRIGSENRIYAGGYNEFGYYELDEMGGAKYNSLSHLLEADDMDFDDVWKIYIHHDGIIFQSYHQMMIYKDNKITIIKAPSFFHFSFIVNDEYYINDREVGLMRYSFGKLHKVIGTENLIGKEIWGIIPINNQLLIATATNGIYFFNGNSLEPGNEEANEFLKKNQIFSLKELKSGEIVFGTIQNGLLITNSKTKPLIQLNTEDGLQNNTVLSIDQDKAGNLWLGTDRGIDFIEITSPLSRLSANYGLGTGYAAEILDDNIYFGTNQGLYFKDNSIERSSFPVKNKKVKQVQGTNGQVWSIKKFGNALFCGHNNGTFLIQDQKAKKIGAIPGGWTYTLVPGNENRIIGGTYTGLQLFEKTNGEWTFVKEFIGYNQSSRNIAFCDDGTLWIAHGYKGIFHVYFNPTFDSIMKVEYFNSSEELMNAQIYDIFKFDNELIFCSSKGFLKHDLETNKIISDTQTNTIFNNQIVNKIYQTQNNDYWYFSNKKAGVLRKREDGFYMNITSPFNSLEDNFVSGFELAYPTTSESVIFGIEDGFAYYNPSSIQITSNEVDVYLRSMTAGNIDTTIVFINKKRLEDIIIDFKHNSVGFEYSANCYRKHMNIQYSSFLEGFDNNWTSWQEKNTRNFTNLYEGTYTFHIRVLNQDGNLSSSKSITFEIKPPFHRSVIAYIIYAIIMLLLIMLFIYSMKKRIERIKLKQQKDQENIYRQKEEQLQHNALIAEKELVRLKNDKLRQEMKQKDKELANSTMQTLHKNEVLITIKQKLKKIDSESKDEYSKQQSKLLQKRINKEINSEKLWEVFETQFENVHEEFLKRIKNTFPDITPRELKLCAYLKMNISSKEIAVLMNISTRGVEISRYRLRKKLKLGRSENLTNFILTF